MWLNRHAWKGPSRLNVGEKLACASLQARADGEPQAVREVESRAQILKLQMRLVQTLLVQSSVPPGNHTRYCGIYYLSSVHTKPQCLDQHQPAGAFSDSSRHNAPGVLDWSDAGW